MELRITAQYRGQWLAGDVSLTSAGSYAGPMPCVGDWAEVRSTQIIGIRPRTSLFQRRAAGRATVPQPIAANVDLALIVMGLDGDFNLRRLERYLVLVRDSGAQALVVLNKADLVPDRAGREASVIATCAGQADVQTISAKTGENLGEIWHRLTPGVTAVLLGSSGAGKSTLLNRLLNEPRMETGTVRESDDRGRHTTTHRELIAIPGGAFVIDTPGMRELQLWVDEDAIAQAFPAIEEIANHCRFHDCRHQDEPGCAVRAAVEAGQIDPSQLENQRKLMREAERLRAASDIHEHHHRKSKLKAMHRALRNHPKFRP